MLCHLHAAVAEGNAQENLLAWPALARPSVRFDCSFEDVRASGASSSSMQVRAAGSAQAPCPVY